MGVRDGSGRHDYVEQVRVTSPWFVTPQGIHVGSRLSAVLAAFPQARPVPSDASPPVHQRIALYDDRKQGITFEFANGRRVGSPPSLCRAIVIHPKGQGVLDEYYPWYMADEKGRWGYAL